MANKEIIVVGGGMAGLTAALSLAKMGKDVLLIEKNDVCGGLMNTFTQDGFRFEGGARALVNAGLVKPLIKEFSMDIEMLPNPITLGIEDKLLIINGENSLFAYSDADEDSITCFFISVFDSKTSIALGNSDFIKFKFCKVPFKI